MKLYLVLGDPLMEAGGPLGELYRHVRDQIEPLFLQGQLRAARGRLILGTDLFAEAGLELLSGKKWQLGARGELSSDRFGWLGAAEQYQVEEPEWGEARDYHLITLGFGVTAGFGTSLGLEGAAGTRRKSRNWEVDLMDLLNFSGAWTFEVGLALDHQTLRPRRVLVETSAEVTDEFLPLLLGWLQHLPREAGRERYNTTWLQQSVTFDLPEAGLLSRLEAGAPIWAILSNPGAGSTLRLDQPAALAGSLLAATLNEGRTLRYERTVHLAEVLGLAPGVGLDLGLAGLEVGLEGELEKGAEWVVEKGKIWQNKRMVLWSGPKADPNQIPQESALDIEGRWAANAADALAEALGRVVARVAETGQTLIEVGREAAKGVLQLSAGVLSAGTEVVALHVRSDSPGRVGLHGPVGDDGYLPPVGAANYRYGVSGVYRFHTPNALAGSAQLTLEYQDADVTGLDESTLRVFWLAENTNQWRFVGGRVDVGVNRVTTEITRLGTFALAPPLPTGVLQLVPSAERLTADGQSTVTFVASNLVLNTGASLSGPWLFTVEVNGGTLLETDVRTETPGIQVAATNAVLRFSVRAPEGGANDERPGQQSGGRCPRRISSALGRFHPARSGCQSYSPGRAKPDLAQLERQPRRRPGRVPRLLSRRCTRTSLGRDRGGRGTRFSGAHGNNQPGPPRAGCLDELFPHRHRGGCCRK